MSWYGDAWDWTKESAGDAYDWTAGKINDQRKEGGLIGDPTGTQARQDQGAAASGFAGGAEERFGALGDKAGEQFQYMEDIARGRESVSALQLKQALGQNIAGQQAMAASARPGSGAMAARGAMQNAARMGAGLAGQQAVAGMQERQAAQNALNQMLMEQRQQELRASLGSRQNAITAYSPNGASGAEKSAGALAGVLDWVF